MAIDSGVRADANWYAGIVQRGYDFSPHQNSSIAFFPLYPLAVKGLSLVVGNVYVAGMILSTLALFAAVALLAVWLRDRGQGTGAPLTVLLMLSFPWAVFYSAMYPEALYLMLVLASFVAVERRAWLLASVAAFLLALLHPTSVAAFPALAILGYRATGASPARFLPPASLVAGLASFSLYQYVRFGSPLASMETVHNPPWSRSVSQAVRDVTLQASPDHPRPYMILMLLIGVLFLSLVPVVYREFGLAYATFALLCIAVPASTGLISMNRYVIIDFPAFAAIIALRRPLLVTGIVSFQIWGLMFITGAFEAGWSVF
jgi:hypothetical protein